MEYLFILGRVLLGGYFMMNGFNHFKHLQNMTGYAASKGVPMPKLAVSITGLMLLLGGAGILLGVYVTYAVKLLVVFLVGVTFNMHQFWKIADPMQRMGEEVNFYKNLGLLGAVLMLLSIPLPWALSLF
ncbi:MAG: DoxX family membrane protein [Candidatus Paceibacterota bacterium]|jgi:uncharacterized membrane protein YphA (DoxX/SURF4 family)